MSPKCRGRFSAASRPTPEEIGGVNWGHYSMAGVTVSAKLNLYLTLKDVKTNIYVDGFNLYFRCLQGTPCKWLDIAKMCQLLLPHNTINEIKYLLRT